MRLGLILLLASIGCVRSAEKAVLVVGDGISVELLTAARLHGRGVEGALALESFPHLALVRTHSANNVVTDSAAAATAFARGIKTSNGRVGSAPDDTAPPSILDKAKAAGWNTAVVTDDSVTGATPASFMVEQARRNDDHLIASGILDALGRRVDMVLGGGRSWFDNSSQQPDPAMADVIAKTSMRLSDAGQVFTDWKSFNSSTPTLDRPVLGLFHPDTFPYLAQGPRSPRLLEMVQAAVAILEAAGKPYFLIVEASLPDKASHQNQAGSAIREVLEMDDVLGWLDATLSDESLLLATTDHGTGGLAINGYFPKLVRGDVLTGMNPVTGEWYLSWATGPGGRRPDGEVVTSVDEPATRRQIAATYALSAKHTGGDVWLIGRGPGSDKVRGFMDNTQVFSILADAISSGE